MSKDKGDITRGENLMDLLDQNLKIADEQLRKTNMN